MKGLYGLFHESSQKFTNKTFVECAERIWTYFQADVMIQQFSEYLQRYGVVKGDRAIIFCDNSIEYIMAYFAVLRINAVAVPVNPLKPADSIFYIIEKCSPRLIITCSTASERLLKLNPKPSTDILNIDGFKAPPLLGDDTDLPQEIIEDENDNAVILFTSGTTAYPKGVTLTHKNLLSNTKAILEYLKLTSTDSVLMTLPFTYSYGNSVLLTHTAVGASIIIDNYAAYPYKILEDIKKHRVTGFSTIGSYISLLLRCIRSSSTDEGFFGSLRYITLAGEAVNDIDISFIRSEFPVLKVFVMYGQTEASARLSYLNPELLSVKTGSVGKGLSNTELRVVDESGADIKPGEIGEIIARGPGIMKCYWDDPEETDAVLKNGWLYTGDNAVVDDDGYIYIKGRKTDMIKHMGHRISPAEIENVINSLDFVRESAVVENVLGSLSVIKAYIVPEKECSLDEIKKYVYSKLPNFMCPQVFEFVRQLPKTDTGKIKRSALRRS